MDFKGVDTEKNVCDDLLFANSNIQDGQRSFMHILVLIKNLMTFTFKKQFELIVSNDRSLQTPENFQLLFLVF